MKTKIHTKINWPEKLKKDFQELIERQLKRNKLSHAYLLVLNNKDQDFAKFFAKVLLCESDKKPCQKNQCCLAFDFGVHPDFIYIKKLEDKKEIHIEAIRELRRKISLRAQKRRVILIENAHELNRESANALLKNIEEPGKENIFILTTSDRKKIIPTIASRCQSYFLKNSLDKEFSGHGKLTIEFLNSDLINRFYMIETISKNKEEASDFLLKLEYFYREKLLKEDDSDKSQIVENLKLLARGRDLLKRNISARLLLENVSLHLSQEKE